VVEPRLRAGLWEGAYWSQNSGLRIHEVWKHTGCFSKHSLTHTHTHILLLLLTWEMIIRIEIFKTIKKKVSKSTLRKEVR